MGVCYSVMHCPINLVEAVSHLDCYLTVKWSLLICVILSLLCSSTTFLVLCILCGCIDPSLCIQYYIEIVYVILAISVYCFTSYLIEFISLYFLLRSRCGAVHVHFLLSLLFTGSVAIWVRRYCNSSAREVPL